MVSLMVYLGEIFSLEVDIRWVWWSVNPDEIFSLEVDIGWVWWS